MEEERAPQQDSPAASPTSRQRVSGGPNRDPEPRGENPSAEALVLSFLVSTLPCWQLPAAVVAGPTPPPEDFFPFVTSVTAFVTPYIVETRIHFKL